MTAGTFDETIRSAIIGSGLAQANEEINPAELLDAQGRVTRKGDGGIPSRDPVHEETRAVQPSQFGIIDFLRTAESEKAGVDMRIARGARRVVMGGCTFRSGIAKDDLSGSPPRI